jgi:hypothetical protein
MNQLMEDGGQPAEAKWSEHCARTLPQRAKDKEEMFTYLQLL